MFVSNCVEACRRALQADGHFLLEHPKDLGAVQGESRGTIWQWDEVLDLLSFKGVCTFALHQCHFGADTPKPTRLMTSLPIQDSRCYFSLPQIDENGSYKGPLPRDCGHFHQQKLIGKSGDSWKTSPSAAYPEGMCDFLATQILSAHAPSGGGNKNLPVKRKAVTLGESCSSSTLHHPLTTKRQYWMIH